MTLLEFCKNFFPDEEIFSEQDGKLVVNTRRLLDLEKEGEWESHRITWSQLIPSDILRMLEPGEWGFYDARCDYGEKGWQGPSSLTLSEESARIMNTLRLVIDPPVAGMDFDVRRPYFRMRGKPVTEEQAFDIIRRTDIFFQCYMNDYHLKGLVGSGTALDNGWYSTNSLYPRGWARPDGVIGMNGVTDKYPLEKEFMYNVLPLKLAFPYLDMMIAVTDWDEAPGYAWDAYFGRDDDDNKEPDDRDLDVFSWEDYPDFLEHIVYGIWLHGDTIELMAPERAKEKYEEYDRLYGGPDDNIFKSDYYEDNNIHPADFEYLKRCIRSHGLDPEEVLAQYVWGPKGLSRKRTEQDTGGAVMLTGGVS